MDHLSLQFTLSIVLIICHKVVINESVDHVNEKRYYICRSKSKACWVSSSLIVITAYRQVGLGANELWVNFVKSAPNDLEMLKVKSIHICISNPHPGAKFSCVSLYDELFSRYGPIFWEKCTEWPRSFWSHLVHFSQNWVVAQKWLIVEQNGWIFGPQGVYAARINWYYWCTIIPYYLAHFSEKRGITRRQLIVEWNGS